MVDRQMFGDLALAVMLVLPTAALARTEWADTGKAQVSPAPLVHTTASVKAPTDGRISLLG